MKKFIIKLLLFLLPILSIGIILEVLLRQIPNDYKFKKEYLDKYADKIEVLILGSSHSFYGINPTYLDYKSFNVGNLSQTYKYDLAILEKYESKLQNLKHLVLPISYFSLFDKLEEKQDWRTSYYVINYGFPSPSIKDYSKLVSNKLDINLELIKRYYIYGRENSLSSGEGWARRFYFGNKQDLDITGMKAAKAHTANTFSNFQENLNTLNSIIEFCKINGIKIYLFTPPTYNTYSEALDKRQLDLTIETANELSRKYDHVVYFNWMNEATFTSMDYFDADHLNKIGSKKLTLKINSFLKKNTDKAFLE